MGDTRFPRRQIVLAKFENGSAERDFAPTSKPSHKRPPLLRTSINLTIRKGSTIGELLNEVWGLEAPV